MATVHCRWHQNRWHFWDSYFTR